MSAGATRGRGAGKVIVLGEHAAVYGHAAVAGAIDRAVVATATARPGPLTLAVTGAFTVAVAAADDHPVAAALRAIAAALAVDGGHAITAEATLPAGAGLGSSAALCVAVTRALAAAGGRALTDAEVAAIANDAERSFHGNPSGLDAALAAHGGLGRFVRGHGLTPIVGPPLPMAIGLSGEPRSTAAMVARVADARAADRAAADRRLARLGALADDASAWLTTGATAWPALGAAMDEAHAHLAALGVSTPGLDAMVAAARAAGALGAKLTGGGGGGAVIALAPGREDAVVAAWAALGATGFVTTVGAPP
ncbi:MAG: mevalonate kinase [Myxococcales bacterium]|nr:mevalonate kinase [Myxococcales bacterium]